MNLGTNRVPVADAGPDQALNLGYTAALNGRGSFDPDGDVITYAWSALSIPIGSLVELENPESVNPTITPDVAGTYIIRLVVNDGVNDSLADTMTLTVTDPNANRPPQIESLLPLAAMVSVPYTYQVAANDPDGDPLSYALSRPPAGMSITTNGLLSWTPVTNGTFAVQITVDDGRGGMDLQAYALAVFPYENRAPEIISTPDMSAEPGQLYTYDVEAIDFNQDPLTYTLNEAPAGMTINTNSGLIEWTPATNDLGGYRVEAEVSDPFGVGRDADLYRGGGCRAGKLAGSESDPGPSG